MWSSSEWSGWKTPLHNRARAHTHVRTWRSRCTCAAGLSARHHASQSRLVGDIEAVRGIPQIQCMWRRGSADGKDIPCILEPSVRPPWRQRDCAGSSIAGVGAQGLERHAVAGSGIRLLSAVLVMASTDIWAAVVAPGLARPQRKAIFRQQKDSEVRRIAFRWLSVTGLMPPRGMSGSTSRRDIPFPQKGS